MKLHEALGKSTLVRNAGVAKGEWLRFMPESNTFHCFSTGALIATFEPDSDGWEIGTPSMIKV